MLRLIRTTKDYEKYHKIRQVLRNRRVPTVAPRFNPYLLLDMKITEKQAYRLAMNFNKMPPYRGYAMDLGGGLVLSHTKKGEYWIIDFPVTPEKVAEFERENKEFIESLPKPDPTKLLAKIREQFFTTKTDS